LSKPPSAGKKVTRAGRGEHGAACESLCHNLTRTLACMLLQVTLQFFTQRGPETRDDDEISATQLNPAAPRSATVVTSNGKVRFAELIRLAVAMTSLGYGSARGHTAVDLNDQQLSSRRKIPD
jgi:hypothetical protein